MIIGTWGLKPVDPVTLGLCKQIDLDTEVEKAAKRVARQRKIEQNSCIGCHAMPADAVLEPEYRHMKRICPYQVQNPPMLGQSQTLHQPEEEEAPSAETVFGNFGTSTDEETRLLVVQFLRCGVS